jgi:hypothetical protein
VAGWRLAFIRAVPSMHTRAAAAMEHDVELTVAEPAAAAGAAKQPSWSRWSGRCGAGCAV